MAFEPRVSGNLPIVRKRNNLDDLMLGMTRVLISDVVSEDQWSAVTVSSNDNLSDAFEALAGNDLQGCPVLNQFGRYIGFVEMADLVGSVIDMIDSALPAERFNRDYFRQEMRFMSATVSSVKHRQIRRETHPYLSLYHAFENLAQYDEHRMALLDRNMRVQGVITQATVVKWICSNMNLLGASKLNHVYTIRPYTSLVTVNENSTALSAFKIMRWNKISGLAVVSNEGRLVDVISNTDLKGIVPGNERFRNMWLTVREFKNIVRNDYPQTSWGIQCVARDDNLETVMNKMDLWNVHRVVVVDNKASMVPIDMISMTDVLDYLLRCSKIPTTI